MRPYSICILIGIFLLLIGTSSTDTEIIYWTEDYKLTWEDFEGSPRFEYQTISAITSSGIVHYKGCNDGQIIYKIQAYFEKNESWVKNEARTDHHLIHEQIHFDITELHARKLRKALADRSFKCGEEEAFEEFVSNFINNWQNDQQAYDILTYHSMDKKAQKEWYYKVAMELSLLDNYK